MNTRALSKRHPGLFYTALKGSPDVIHRVSPETGKLMEHIGDNAYRDQDTGKVYKSVGSVAGQTKQDQMLYPLSA